MRIILTHDADSISKPFQHIWKRRDRFTEQDLKDAKKGARNLYNNILDVVSLETDLGFKSTFFIPVFLFNLHDIMDTLQMIKQEGTEVQLHYVHEEQNPQYEGLFRIQRNFFEDLLGPIDGVRCHGLQITEELLKLFDAEGLRYDSSYRIETVGTFDPYKICERLLEIPIGVMDADVFGRLQLAESKAWKYLLNRLESAEAAKAEYFTVLFHQESFRMKGGRLYERLIRYLAENNYESIRCKDAVTLLQQQP